VTRARSWTALAALLGLALAVVIVTGRPRGVLVASLLAAGAGAALLAGRAARPPGGRPPGAHVMLVLLLLVAAVQLHTAGGRLGGDGVSYYVYVRSLMKDHDLDFTDEYTHYELIDRVDIKVPTRTGLRRSIFAVGPGLVWIPFFLAGEGVARVEAALGRDVDLSGYGPEHVNAVALGSLLYGFLAVVLIHSVLRRHFPADTALLGALLVWWATFLQWYMVHQPAMSHAASAAGAALVVFLWDRHRPRPTPWTALALGLAAGLAMCLRWQNAVLLLLPGWDVAAALAAGGREAVAAVRRGALIVGAALLGAVPQMAAWKTIYGEWLLRYPPHGADFLRLDHPFVLQTLFSSRHGLLSWTPVFWAGYLGYLWLARARRPLFWPLVLPLLAMTYVNMCSGDWWAGGSFSNRRFDSLLPLLAIGMAGALEWTRRALARHPQAAVGALLVPVMTWNLGAMAQVARGEARADRSAFHRLAGGTARLIAEVAGSPPTWPASWLFAWREGRPARQYDRAVGRYLFYRQNNLGGRIAVGSDDALLAEGWGPREEKGGIPCRAAVASARVLAPLDVPEDLTLAVRTPSGRPSPIRVRVNGREGGALAATGDDTTSPLLLPARLWRRELNDVVLVPEDGAVCVSALDFARVGAVAAAPAGTR